MRRIVRAAESVWLRWVSWTHRVQLVNRHLAAVLRPMPAPGPAPTRPVSGPDPLEVTRRVPLKQPDRTSCASSVIVMVKMLRDPEYAEKVLGGHDPAERFGAEALATRQRTHGPFDGSGRLQLPWLAYYGTRGPALIRELGGGMSRFFVDPRHPERAYEALVAAEAPVVLFIGNGFWTQHAVLVTAATPEHLDIYDPAAGRVLRRSRERFETARLAVARWDQPWLLILPPDGLRPRARRTAA